LAGCKATGVLPSVRPAHSWHGEIGGAYNKYVKEDKLHGNFDRKIRKKQFGRCIDGRIILKWVLKEGGVEWLAIRPCRELL
jgi:hypothetical protein